MILKNKMQLEQDQKVDIYRSCFRSSAVFYHFFELRFRFSYIFSSFLFSFLTSYYYSSDFIYLFVRPFFAPKNFIFTDPTEALSITLKICFLFSLNFIIPLLFYQLWCFIIPSFFVNERKKINFFLFFTIILNFFALLFVYFFLLPEIGNFLFSYQINKELITIKLEARIYSYVEFSIYIYILAILLFQIPLIFSLLFSFNLFTPNNLSKIRKPLFFSFFLFAALISPPDVFSQLYLAFFFMIIYEITLWLGFIYQKQNVRLQYSNH